MIEYVKQFLFTFTVLASIATALGTLLQAIAEGVRAGFWSAMPWGLSCAAFVTLLVVVVLARLDADEPPASPPTPPAPLPAP